MAKRVLSPEQIAKMKVAKAKNGNVPRKTNPMDLSALKSIRKYCVEMCCCGQFTEVKECTIPKCPLYPYRFGKLPTIGDTESHTACRSTDS